MIGVDRQYIPKFAVAFICFASVAIAAPTVTFTVQTPTGPGFAGVYISPYTATINSGTPVPAICDDWADDVSVSPPETWTAYSTNLGTDDLSQSNVYYSEYNTYNTTTNVYISTVNNKTVAYDAAAILAEKLLTLPPNPYNPTDTLSQEAYSFAIWELFDNNIGMNGGPSKDLTIYGASAVSTLAAQYLSDALAQAQGVTSATQNQFSNVTIYSAVPGSQPQGYPQPQEFIVVNMSEGPAASLLGVYVLGLGCLAFVFRRRVVRSSN